MSEDARRQSLERLIDHEILRHLPPNSVRVDLGPVRGTDVEFVRVNADGLVLDDLPDNVDGTYDLNGESREPGVIREFQVSARAMTVFGMQADLFLDGRNFPIVWVAKPDGTYVVDTPDQADPDTDVAGQLRLDQSQLPAALNRLFAQPAIHDEVPFDVEVDELTLTATGPRSLDIQGSGRVSKGPVGGTVQLSGVADVDDRFVLRVRDAKLSTGNFLLKPVLAMAAPYLEDITLPLGDLGPDAELADLRVSTDPDLAVEFHIRATGAAA